MLTLSSKQKHNLLLVTVIVIGILLRVYSFPSPPPGLNQDEASAGYEAYSLLLTGKDRWSNPWPVYFTAQGSGQNVLYSYLLIPLINIFGLTILTVRSINLIFGILTLPLLYITVRKIFDKRVALIATLLMSILPWHIMLSRWGLESNLLPFFLLLGTYTVAKFLIDNHQNNLGIIAFVPWAFGLYSYATSYFVIPPLLLLVIIRYRKLFWRNFWQWSGAIIFFLILAFPLFLFVIKNFILHSNFIFDEVFPFSIPLLPSSRLSEASQSVPENLYHNLSSILNGFSDRYIFNTYLPFLPLSSVLIPWFVVGLFIYLGIKKDFDLFFLWFVACLPLIFFTKLESLNRGNAFLITIIVIASFAFLEILKLLSSENLKKLLAIALALYIVLNSILFGVKYFTRYEEDAASSFKVGLDKAIAQAYIAVSA